MSKTPSSVPPAMPEQATRPPLAVAVLGGVGLALDGAALRLPNRKARALLAYLTMSDSGAERRERLAGLLWGEATEEHARTSLRRVLSDLRESLEAVGFRGLTAGRETVALARGSVLLDTDPLLREVMAGEVPALLQAQPTLPDSLLAGYEDIGPLFRDWVGAARHAFRAALQRALEQGWRNKALPARQRRRLAEAALALDPLDEAACRAVMRRAAEAGEIGAALRAYGQLYQALDAELDMEPSPATQELVAAIKQGRYGATQPPAAAPAAPAALALARPFGGPPMVAVLPFRALGGDGVPDYLAEGLVEDVVRELAALREPVVISANSTRGFRGSTPDLAEIGRQLGVRYLVTGTVRVAATRLRLAVELVEAASRAVLWSNRYDAVEALLFETQDEIAASIANTLAPKVHEAELRQSHRRPPEDMSAYHLVLQARELQFALEHGQFEAAGQLLHRAIALDPGYASSHAALAAWYSLRIGQGWSPAPAADSRALEQAAETAIRLDSGNARALALLGHSHTILKRDYGRARTLLDRALHASPNDAEAWMWSSPTHAYAGDPKEAVQRAERAMQLSPQDPFQFRCEHFLCVAHYADGAYEEAAHWGRRSLERNPHYLSNIRMTMAALAGMGRAAEARPLAGTVLALQPGFRVGPLVAQQAFRNEAQRERYGQHLIEAGLPP